MADDYFDDASDADFLALAQQLDSRQSASVNRNGATTAVNAAPRPVGARTTTSKTTIPASDAVPQPDTSKVNQTAPRVLRPGFNAIIVNTRQVVPLQSTKLIY